MQGTPCPLSLLPRAESQLSERSSTLDVACYASTPRENSPREPLELQYERTFARAVTRYAQLSLCSQ
jgi:hypothetical protein